MVAYANHVHTAVVHAEDGGTIELEGRDEAAAALAFHTVTCPDKQLRVTYGMTTDGREQYMCLPLPVFTHVYFLYAESFGGGLSEVLPFMSWNRFNNLEPCRTRDEFIEAAAAVFGAVKIDGGQWVEFADGTVAFFEVLCD